MTLTETCDFEVSRTDIERRIWRRGRCYENIFIEKPWRTVKYQHLHLHAEWE